MKKLFVGAITLTLIVITVLLVGNDIIILFENSINSISHGSYSKGSLENGKRLPTKGANFVTYSYMGSLIGRNCVNDKVKDIVVETYKIVRGEFPKKTFVIGETGWPGGGEFWPHKTHENGLSVDFIVPVVNKKNRSVRLHTNIINLFGYGLEFDKNGEIEDSLCVDDLIKKLGTERRNIVTYILKFIPIFNKTDRHIDFDAMAIHLFFLNEEAKKHGMGIRIVIFDPELQKYLFETEYGKKIKWKIPFSTKKSWIRHDEHYHVDFYLK